MLHMSWVQVQQPQEPEQPQDLRMLKQPEKHQEHFPPQIPHAPQQLGLAQALKEQLLPQAAQLPHAHDGPQEAHAPTHTRHAEQPQEDLLKQQTYCHEPPSNVDHLNQSIRGNWGKLGEGTSPTIVTNSARGTGGHMEALHHLPSLHGI
jgi:hypothetical protein